MSIKIIDGGLEHPAVQALLAHHLRTARAATAVCSAHALDLAGLQAPEITFWSAWDGGHVVGVGALKRLTATHGEVKSMHTDQSRRRSGVGTTVLRHIIAAATGAGMSRLSLETGASPYFEPARAFYKRHGFVGCSPFAAYRPDPNSVFLTLELSSSNPLL